MVYPLKFEPIYKQYLWGGRNLEKFPGKKLPATGPVAESWEIVDRDPENSVIANGPLAGKKLRWLMENHGEELLGQATSLGGRFPLLVKILDAKEKLSLQVHPPAAIAANLGGEPKTEMWYVFDAQEGACFYVGLQRGTTRATFEQALRNGKVAECFHRIEVKPGDAMFLSSGRVHAIGGNCVLFEIMQNSDTTYRVYDWDRVGPDGKRRELHIEQALQCIDFNDFEPSLANAQGSVLVDCPLFRTERLHTARPLSDRCGGKSFHILCGLIGNAQITTPGATESFGPGDSVLLPAQLGDYQVVPAPQMTFLKVSVP